MKLKKYFGFIGFTFYVIAIFLFIPFIITAVFGALAIGVSEKMTVTNYLILLGEVFIGRWFLHIPAITLIVSGYFLINRFSK